MSNKIQIRNMHNGNTIRLIKYLEDNLKRTIDDLVQIDFQIKNNIFPFSVNHGNLVLDPKQWKTSNIHVIRQYIVNSANDLHISIRNAKDMLTIC